MVSDLLAIWMPVSAKEDTCKCIAFTLGFVSRRMLVVGFRPLGATCSRLQGSRTFQDERGPEIRTPPETLLGFVCFRTLGCLKNELAFTPAKNATKPNLSKIIPLQPTRKENSWETEEMMERAAVTLETERAKWPNPGCV
jgi:hypothetical protein